MTTVSRLVLREIALTLREPFTTSQGTTEERRILLVEAIDADGEAGWGECVAQERPSYAPETVDTAWQAISWWAAPAVLGREFPGPEAVWPALEGAFRGHPMAKAAVEMAVWDLAGKAGEWFGPVDEDRPAEAQRAKSPWPRLPLDRSVSERAPKDAALHDATVQQWMGAEKRGATMSCSRPRSNATCSCG